jgi:LysR family hydrogen peroxide-inducible transcriptional activator
MAANGIGVTLLPQMAVEAGIAGNTALVVKPFDQPNITRQIGLMWRKKTPRRVEFRQLGELISASLEG